ncbi:hypothetical protein [Brevundimonas sp.]|jgi:hypothetical protein|uniref:hypothetical protein n=1 Tax=Brevundimonas sp. TaxID=1871086 RepID=UPI002E0DA82A
MEPTTVTTLIIEKPETWPAELMRPLNEHRDVFIDWSQGPSEFSGRDYDFALGEVASELQGYSLTGWHCTRLTDVEIDLITRDGMEPLSGDMLRRRVDRLAEVGHLTWDQADRLKSAHQANDRSRTGMLWFCFFPPHRAGRGIFDLLRFWGGEALYNSHDDDPELGPLLHRLGVPAVVEADVPIALLKGSFRPASALVAHYLKARGLKARDGLEFEDRITEPLPAQCIKRVVRFPSPAFLDLTGSDEWQSDWAETWGERGRGSY